ncbi:MAG TPA: hypothetical protein VMW29_00235 [Candidatus Bathyarchaeia archaeon]|nr:hypothetical protein [Candidatus Bathyarchaeia archaeon]
MVKTLGGFSEDVFGELLETGKAAAKQAGQAVGKIGQAAGQQLGVSSAKQKPVLGGEARNLAPRRDLRPQVEEGGIKDLLPKPVPEERVAQLKQQDALERSKGIDQTRAQLNVLKISRYQELQQRIAEEQKKREEIPQYEAGKTGIRTMEEKVKAMEKQKEEEEKIKKEDTGPLLPDSGSNMPGLPSVKAKKGTHEMGKKLMG